MTYDRSQPNSALTYHFKMSSPRNCGPKHCVSLTTPRTTTGVQNLGIANLNDNYKFPVMERRVQVRNLIVLLKMKIEGL